MVWDEMRTAWYEMRTASLIRSAYLLISEHMLCNRK